MLLSEMWDDIIKQREQAKTNAAPNGKPLTAKERQEKLKQERESKLTAQRDQMKQRALHNRNRSSGDGEESANGDV